jgi:hypothetical protein
MTYLFPSRERERAVADERCFRAATVRERLHAFFARASPDLHFIPRCATLVPWSRRRQHLLIPLARHSPRACTSSFLFLSFL